MRGGATQAMPKRIVKERQRSRCPFPPRPVGLRLAKPLASLLARYIPQRVCSSLAPRHQLCEPAANATVFMKHSTKLAKKSKTDCNLFADTCLNRMRTRHLLSRLAGSGVSTLAGVVSTRACSAGVHARRLLLPPRFNPRAKASATNRSGHARFCSHIQY